MTNLEKINLKIQMKWTVSQRNTNYQYCSEFWKKLESLDRSLSKETGKVTKEITSLPPKKNQAQMFSQRNCTKPSKPESLMFYKLFPIIGKGGIIVKTQFLPSYTQ